MNKEEIKLCKHCKGEINKKAKKCPNCQGDLRNFFRRHPVVTVILIVLLFSIFGSISENREENKNNNVTEKEKTVDVVFDLEQLHGKNIDEIRTILDSFLKKEYLEPTKAQIDLGMTEWDNSFKKDNWELLVTYNVSSRKVVDFFISTNDPSGATKNTRNLEQVLGIKGSKNFRIEPVKVIRDPSSYTGIKAIPVD